MDDIVPLSTPEAARQRCGECRNRIAQLLESGLPSLSDDARVKCIRMLVQFADLQIARVALWSDGPVDLLAYVTRNLLEWSVWCKNVDKLMKDSEVDLIDLVNVNPVFNPGLYSKAFATDEERGPVYTAALEKARDAAANVLKAFENDAGRLPKRVQLSEFRNEIDDYVFKLCSKLLHPTALSILVWPNVTDAQLETNRVHLRTLALYYADVGLDALLVGLC